MTAQLQTTASVDGFAGKPEEAEFRPAAHHTEQQVRRLEAVAAGRGHWRLETYEWLKEDPQALEAFRRIMLHVDRFIDVTSKGRVYKVCRYNKLIHGLAALAYHHRHWLRPLEDWIGMPIKGGQPRCSDQFSGLLRHLLARYEVPNFMDSAFFEGQGEQGVQHQQWFIHLATGGSIRELDISIQLTRRMAHIFMQGYNRKSINDNLRWAQVLGMGGDRTLALTIQRTRLGRSFENDPFWSSVVLFLVNNAMMDPTYVGPVVDYVHHMKFSPRRIVQEGGGVVEAPPPQPHFTMKGRSAAKLLRQVDAWHGHLSRADKVVFQSWQPCGVRPLDRADETQALGPVRWTIQELLSSWELAAEGTAMNHCVVSYSDQCADGRTAIWSVCMQKEGAAEREHVLTVAVDVETRTVTQARGRYNAVPNRPPRTARAREESRTGYVDMLNRADRILALWIERENLRRED